MNTRSHHYNRSPLQWVVAGILAMSPAVPVHKVLAAPFGVRVDFSIPAGSLADALDRFSAQSGLQIAYDHDLVSELQAQSVSGTMPASEAIERLLRGTDLVWAHVNDMSIAVRRQTTSADPLPGRPRAERSELTAVTHGGITQLSDISVSEDPRRVLPNEASGASFGFSKPLLETPRSVSVISAETIDLFGLSAVEDLVSVVPGVFTTTRFGIQGAVDVRNVPADTYFRGMKRLTLQGHGRSVLAAMDTIEIVGGPASPIYGMGKIGGYTNVVPKSGRAKTGTYLTDTQGFAQVIGGSYERREASFGVGGPMSFLDRFDKQGGYYIYGLVEDSGSYTLGVPVEQRVLQIATSIDEFAGPFRLETGLSYQESRTAGALTGRFTQDLADNGRYIRGTPLMNLDANGNGSIGYLEMHNGSPTQGSLSSANQPLMQTWLWPLDANGRPLPLDQMPIVQGIPQTMYDYLLAHPEADPTGLLRAQGVGGPVPVSGSVPVGMVLDPRTVGYDQLDRRRAAAFEKDLKAEFMTAFFDLVYDVNPDFTIKNQLFFDGMSQYKDSNQPFVQEQDVYVLEDKLTATRRVSGLPSWLKVNALASLNVRHTVSKGRNSGTGDFSNARTDAMAPTWDSDLGGMTPNTTFSSPRDNQDLGTDGYPWVNVYRTEFSEFGMGALFDIDLFERNNLLLGGRYDTSRAKNVDYAGEFNPNTGTSANPGLYAPTNVVAKGWDSGASWSASWSYQLPRNWRPYVTWAESSIMLDGNNNALTNDIINAGHVGSAELREAGIKGSLLGNRMFVSASAFRQARTGIDGDDLPDLLYAYATATVTRGWEAELKWVPIRNLFMSLYVLEQTTKFDPNIGSHQIVDARTLGFQDVLDANGNVIYPAEAFLYGGRARIRLPDNMPQYEKKQGNPETQVGLTSSYQWRNGLGFTMSGNYFSSTCNGRLCTVRLPEAYLFNAGLFVDVGSWSAKLDVSNVFDEEFFRARTGDTLGNVLAQAMPGRRWQLTIRRAF